MSHARPKSLTAVSDFCLRSRPPAPPKAYHLHYGRRRFWKVFDYQSAASTPSNKLREYSLNTLSPKMFPRAFVRDLVSPTRISRQVVRRLTDVGLLFRTPQKWECSVGMFAVSHTFDTRITTAMSLGYAFDLDTFDTKRASTFGKFVNQLNENRDFWTHPMMLP